MRHAFWLINSTLLLLTLVMVGFIFFSQQHPAEREDIEPEASPKVPITAISKVNIQKIYENDLFGTYQKEFPMPTTTPISSLPEAPLPHPLLVPEEPKPEFLEPLPITLKGIIVVLSDDTKNRAIIDDTRTGQEAAYKVGDKLEDAQLIRIFNNKALFLRSNGQQEVLYLREKDAKSDPLYASIENWTTTIKQTGPFNFLINTNEFIGRVPSLGQIIDILDLTTVYKQGESVGMRVGQIAADSLGPALGLQKGDIITMLNAIPTTTTALRFDAYQKVLSLESGDTVTIELYRYGRPVTISYTLKEVSTVSGVAKSEMVAHASDRMAKEQIKHLEKKHTFAPTLQEIREKEKKTMLERGKRPTKNVLSQLNE